MGVDNYHLSCDWCVLPTGEVNLDCQQRIVEDGLLKYPEDQNLHLNMAKILRKRAQAPQAYPHALKALGNTDPATNISLTLFVAQTAILSGLCDDAERLCKMVEENCGGDDSAMKSVQQIKESIVEVRENQQQKTTRRPRSVGIGNL
ncbi:hypothetical protein DPMN_042588 [Dreissena polymorpha]|uniref:Uncharacterized protein n=1 Tax=Dreissena polymorpha TaxID=45954 RepID=A0A9D4HX63_DREPO|nr:hypothetical protein DPMN_042588 [Dreissena polymorpha]